MVAIGRANYRVKVTDNNIYAIAGADRLALIGKRHPVDLGGLGRAALAKLADFLKGRQ
jgi:hypothetical protein